MNIYSQVQFRSYKYTSSQGQNQDFLFGGPKLETKKQKQKKKNKKNHLLITRYIQILKTVLIYEKCKLISILFFFFLETNTHTQGRGKRVQRQRQYTPELHSKVMVTFKRG